MNTKTLLPFSIQNILTALGAGRITGTLAYCGGHEITYRHPTEYREEECRPDAPSSVDEHGLIQAPVSVAFRVNGKRGRSWKILVAYEPDDTFTVYLWQRATRSQRDEKGIIGEVITERRDVYIDELARSVEGIYDDAIRTLCGGFIPLG